MAVTLNEISGWLDNIEVKHNLDEDVITFGTSDGENYQSVFIRTKEDGALFDLNMQLLNKEELSNVTIKDHEHLDKLLPHLLYLNYKTKFGTWEFDPNDGDVRLAIELPLEDAQMTEKQFMRIFDYVTDDAQSHANQIRNIMINGVAPDKKDEEIEMLKAMMMRMLAAQSSKDDQNEGI